MTQMAMGLEKQESPAQRAARLREEIRHHDRLYHTENRPEISDSAYDSMFQELKNIEEQHPEARDADSPTNRAGSEPIEGFSQVTHAEPMLSLGNAFTEDDFRKWHRRMADSLGNREFVVSGELKIDGVAFRVEYREGRLTRAATRGDGQTGEDITHTVRTVRSLPLTLGRDGPRTLDARGEIYIGRRDFEALNREKEEQGEAPYANARNAAAGAVRQLDAQEAQKRRLSAWIYSSQNDGQGDSHLTNLQTLSNDGLPVNPANRRLRNADEAVAFYHDMMDARENLDYEADGVVFKVDSVAAQQVLGATGHEPRWAIAWKFPAEKATTKLIRVDISHGRFGKLTPVAVLEPVKVAGVTVRNATLHNEEDMRRKDIREGDTVTIERAGDVIPQVTGPLDTNPNRETPVFTMPEHCPSCGAEVLTIAGEVGHWCPNDDCPSLLPEQLKHFVSKRAMNIENMGEHWCQALVERGLVSNPADLYALTKGQLLTLERMGERSANRILANIDGSRNRPLDRVLYSLGIYRLGREVSTLLAERYTSVDEVAGLDEAQIAAIDGIGPKIAESVYQGMRSERTLRTITGLREGGVRLERAEEPQQKEAVQHMQQETPFSGKNFVVTGKLESMKRDEAHAEIQRRGGFTGSSVTAKTNTLILGGGPDADMSNPSTKLKKAMSNPNVEIIREADFLKMLEA